MTWVRGTAVLAVGILSALLAIIMAAGLVIGTETPEPLPWVGNTSVQEIPAEAGEQWSVALMADVQDGIHYFPELLRRAGARGPKAIFVLGDFAMDHNEVHQQIAVRAMREAVPSVPTFVIPGNHDVLQDEGRASFLGWYGATTFDVRIGPVRFIGMDNASGPLGPEALAALRVKLADARSRREHVVLCVHRDIIDWPDKLKHGAEAENQPLVDVIREFGPDLVLCGHYHTAHYEERDGTRFIVLPASGNRSRNLDYDRPIAYTLLTWTGSDFEFEEERLFRRNSTELRGVITHIGMAHVATLHDRLPALFLAVLAAAVVVAAGGTWLGVRALREGGRP